MSDDTQVWDGVPRLYLSRDQLFWLYSFVPQWRGRAVGPLVPFAHGERVHFSVEAIFRPTKEEAEEAMWYHVENACKHEGMAYDQEQWTLYDLRLVGGC